MTYREKTPDGDSTRADPNGFYPGMVVKHAGEAFVLRGLSVEFVPGQTEQRSLL